MKKLLAILLLIAAPAFAGRVAECDPVTNYVTGYSASANTPDFVGAEYRINTPGLMGGPLVDAGGHPLITVRDWICDPADVREMTAQEKSDRDAAYDAEIDLLIRANAKGAFDGHTVDGQRLRALIEVLIDEINILRAQHGLADRTLAQAKTAIRSKIDSGDVDE